MKRLLRDDSFWFMVGTSIMLFIIVGIFIWSFSPKSDEIGALHVLEVSGYRDIKITGASLFGCGSGDFYRTSFTATGLNGSEVNGVVCSGIFKDSTIRINN